ncbi:RNA helicase, partial [Burkholderia pseudomallei]|nr:RNA helicase [Burkholderia pseudomallei]
QQGQAAARRDGGAQAKAAKPQQARGGNSRPAGNGNSNGGGAHANRSRSSRSGQRGR